MSTNFRVTSNKYNKLAHLSYLYVSKEGFSRLCKVSRQNAEDKVLQEQGIYVKIRSNMYNLKWSPLIKEDDEIYFNMANRTTAQFPFNTEINVQPINNVKEILNENKM